MSTITHVYGDGATFRDGLIGTWAWCHVNDKDERVAEASGVVQAADVGRARTLSHLMEILALLSGLEALPNKWSGVVRSDSQGALKVVSGSKLNKIPMPWATRIVLVKRRLGPLTFEWIRGHPNFADLQQGYRYGVPVSRHNVYVDLRCRAESESWLQGKTEGHTRVEGAWSWW